MFIKLFLINFQVLSSFFFTYTSLITKLKYAIQGISQMLLKVTLVYTIKNEVFLTFMTIFSRFQLSSTSFYQLSA